MIDDAAILATLESQLKHEPPFSSDELDSITVLRVNHLRHPEQLNEFPNLKTLNVEHAEFPDLEAISNLSKLLNLRVTRSTLSSLDDVQTLDNLEFLELTYCRISDLSPLSAHSLSSMKVIDLQGNPLSLESREGLVPQIEELGIFVDIDDKELWQVNSKLAERGLPVSAYRDRNKPDELRLWMVGPKVERLTRFDRPCIPLEELDTWLSGDVLDLEALYRNYQPERPKSKLDIDAFKYVKHRYRGSAAEVGERIEAAGLDAQLERALTELTLGFEEHKFYWEDDELLDHVAQRHGIELPEWFRTIRKTQAFIYSDTTPSGSDVRFASSNHEWKTDGKAYGWASMGIYGEEERKLLCEEYGFFPFGYGGSHGEDVLLIRVDEPEDRAVYLFTLEELSRHEDPEPLVLFDDISQMYDSIDSLCGMDGAVVARRKE